MNSLQTGNEPFGIFDKQKIFYQKLHAYFLSQLTIKGSQKVDIILKNTFSIKLP